MECYESDISNESIDLFDLIDDGDDDQASAMSLVESDPLGDAFKPTNEGIKPYQFEPLAPIQGQEAVQNNDHELQDNHRLTTTDWLVDIFTLR